VHQIETSNKVVRFRLHMNCDAVHKRRLTSAKPRLKGTSSQTTNL